MITLSKHESLLLLLTKGWEYIKVPKLRNMQGNICEGDHEYIHRVLATLYGCPPQEPDVFGIYSTIAEKLLTPREILRYFEYTIPGRHFFQYTPSESLIIGLSLVRIMDGDTVLVELDMSEVISSDKFTESMKEKYK